MLSCWAANHPSCEFLANTTFEKRLKTGYYIENLRLGTSAVQHDMKREETVEEVEKNTEWQRRTPKR